MGLFNKPLSEVDIDDIRELVANGVGESRTLDYKLELHGNADGGKKELLKDLSAFANTLGGCLIYGIEEEAGLPKEIVGVEVKDFDKFKLHYENLLRTGVDPAIRGVEFHSVAVDGDKCVIIIEVPKSISRPHAVTIKQHFKFYSRHSSGVHQLEVDDLRRAFLASETTATKIRNFRNDRLSMIAINEGAMPLSNNTATVLHIIPLNSFEVGTKYDFGEDYHLDFRPIRMSGVFSRYNLDGILLYSGDEEKNIASSYTQLFHNGIIEAVDSSMMRSDGKGRKLIPGRIYESEIAIAVGRYLKAFGKYGIDFPVWICLSLLGVKGYSINLDAFFYDGIRPIDRDELILPEIQIENNETSAFQFLKPAFDSIWNACGFKCSDKYDENGNWKFKG